MKILLNLLSFKAEFKSSVLPEYHGLSSQPIETPPADNETGQGFLRVHYSVSKQIL